MKNLISKDQSFYVAGHTGMVGSAVVRALKDKGYCDPNLGGKLLTISRKELDLSSYNDVASWFTSNRPNIVIIAAAKVGGILANIKYPYNFISENLRIQQNIIEAAWLNGTSRLLFLGSSCIYPKNPKLPIKEEQLLGSHLEKTNEPYAIAKIAGIKLCEALRKQHRFDAISLMPSNLYGQGDNYDSQSSHVMASLIKKFINAKRNRSNTITCWGSGNPLREFLHVDDLGASCIHVLEKWNPDHQTAPKDENGNRLFYLNVGSEEEISIKSLAKKIAVITNYQGDIIWDESKPDGTYRKNLDISRIKSLGWAPKIKIDQGIKKTIKEIETLIADESDSGRSLKNFY